MFAGGNEGARRDPPGAQVHMQLIPTTGVNSCANVLGVRKCLHYFGFAAISEFVIQVTKFRDEGHLCDRGLERRCGWNVTVVSAFQFGNLRQG